MELRKLSTSVSKWFDETGNMADIVISSRVRLARNLSGCCFVNSCDESQKLEILKTLETAIDQVNFEKKTGYIRIDQANPIERDFLIERHVISSHLAKETGPRAVIMTQDELFSAMINEEDHLRIQVIKPGLQLQNCWNQVNRIDDAIEENIDYAFSPRLGYLTACPTNIGTGIRVSIMLHLPGIKMVGHLEKFFNTAKAMNMAVRGLFGEGTKAVGDFFQLSNQKTLGISEQDIVNDFTSKIVPKIVEYENIARNELLQKHKHMIEDKIHRAMGILKNARLISSNEALYLLGNLRLGVNMKIIEEPSIKTINELFILTQPAHLQMSTGGPLAPQARDELRAKIIREKLSNL